MAIVAVSIILSLLYFYMGFYAYFIQKDAPANRIFLLLTILFSGWSLSGAFFNVLNIPAFSTLWMFVSYLIWTVGTAFILHFCLSLRRNRGQLPYRTLFLIYAPATILFIGMVFVNGLTPSSKIATSPLQLIFGIPGGIVFYILDISIAIYTLYKMGLQSSETRVKRQSILVSRSLAASSVIIAVYGFVLPPLVSQPLPVLLPFFPAIWITSMWISVTRYGFLTVTMEIATKEILDNIQEIIILTDSKCVIIDVNRKFEETVSVKKEDINGKTLRDVMSKNPGLMHLVEEVLHGKIPFYTGDVEFCLDNGAHLPIRMNITPISHPLNHIAGIIISANDLTLEKKFEQLSITDSLTNAYNRMKMERIIERLILDQQAFSVIIFDMDNFKRINDAFGHSAGDHVLSSTVALINKTLRAIDFIGRWGGEEFLMVLPDVTEHTAFRISERVREAVSTYDFGLNKEITISLGVAEYDSACNNVVEIINRADMALYEAKRSGRNKTLCYSEIPKPQ